MILEILLLVLSIPTGFLIAYLARDELLAGRKYFIALVIGSILAGIWFLFIGIYYLVFVMAFIFVVSLISYMKSYDKKWTKRKL